MTNRHKFIAAMLMLAGVPSQALAFDFGFVRVPDYLDMPIVAAAVFTFIGAVGLKATLPSGTSYTDVDKTERTMPMTVSAYLAMIALALTLGLLFTGMGLQRAAEW